MENIQTSGRKENKSWVYLHYTQVVEKKIFAW
jgi:hypothetical protein